MDLIAKKPVRYAGTTYQPGEAIPVRTPKDAKALKLIGKAMDRPAAVKPARHVASTAPPAPDPAPEPTPVPQPALPERAPVAPAAQPMAPRRGRYGRRDLRAED